MGPKAIDRMLELEPPKQPLDTLEAVWHDFRWRRLARGHRDPTISFTADADSLQEAIRRACDSRGADGKLFFHQGRVWQVNRDEFFRVLSSAPVRRRIRAAENFHNLWSEINTIGGMTHGIGSITSYDVTARLAAWFGYPARRVYLHGGVLEGAKTLGLYRAGAQWIERGQLPRCLRFHVNLDEVEDFLCGYRVLIERVVK